MDCCEKVVQQICDELTDDIDGQICEKLKAHIAECEECRNQLNSMRDTVHLYQCLEDSKVPQDVHERLYQMLNVDNEK